MMTPTGWARSSVWRAPAMMAAVSLASASR